MLFTVLISFLLFIPLFSYVIVAGISFSNRQCDQVHQVAEKRQGWLSFLTGFHGVATRACDAATHATSFFPWHYYSQVVQVVRQKSYSWPDNTPPQSHATSRPSRASSSFSQLSLTSLFSSFTHWPSCQSQAASPTLPPRSFIIHHAFVKSHILRHTRYIRSRHGNHQPAIHNLQASQQP